MGTVREKDCGGRKRQVKGTNGSEVDECEVRVEGGGR